MKYKIQMNKNDFFKIHNRITSSNLEINKDDVFFELDLEGLNFLKKSGYNFYLIDSIKIKIKEFMKKYYLLLFGVLFLFSILYINSYRVDSIIFNIDTPVNKQIEEAIFKSYKKLFNFSFSNLDYSAFSKKLRSTYVEYPYINVYNKNNNIMVDIYSYNDNYPAINDYGELGNIVAAKDGIVDEFYVYNGNCVVSKNKYVKKGDLLIDGKINDDYICSKGLILGYTFEKSSIIVPKTENTEKNSGLFSNYFEINVFNFVLPINKKNSFLKYEKKEIVNFNFFDIFQIKKIEEYEKNDIIKKYTKEDAISIGEQLIKASFEKCKIDNREKIIELTPYDVIETADSFEITYILKKYESLGVFQSI